MHIEPPFIGSKIIDKISIKDIESLIDKTALFVGRWQFKGIGTGDDAARFKAEKVIPIYEKIIASIISKGTIEPKIVYGYFKCEKSGNNLIVRGEKKPYRFDFPREKRTPNRCLADFFKDGFVAFQIVTVGNAVNDEAARMFGDGRYSDTFYIKGFAAEAAEALAKYSHAIIRRELGVGADAGERFSPGYPSFPSLIYQRSIAALLEPARIGISLSKTCMFVPEQTTSAMISIDPDAVHFNPNILS